MLTPKTRYTAITTLLATMLVQSAHGETANDKQHFDIPAQSLNQALLLFGRQSHQQMMYSSSMTENYRSHALKGDYSPQEAINILLSDSALQAVPSSSGSITVKPKPANIQNKAVPADALPVVTVSATVKYDTSDPYNPDYTRPNAITATKTDIPIMETPLSVQVVPKAVINDQQAVRVSDALKNVSGYFDTRGEEFFYDTAFLRGFNTGSSQYIDGLRDISQSHSLANIEQIEVLKGPAGALYGRLEPGGLINYVTKRPLEKSYYSLQQQFGSFNQFRTLGDATGALTKDNSLLYRLNFEYFNSDSFIDVVHKERGFVAPSLTWNISPKTQLDVDFRYHNVNGPSSFGLPAVGNRPASIQLSRYFGEPDLDDGDFSLFYGGMKLAHEFSDNWKLEARAAYNYNHQFSQGIGIDVLDEQTGDASRYLSNFDYNQDSIQGLINLTGKFATWGLEHTLTIGADIFKNDMKTVSWQFLCDGCGGTFPAAINIYQPMIYGQHGVDLTNEPLGAASSGRDQWWGFYLQDQVKIAQDWHLMFGTRYDQARTAWDDTPTTDDGKFSPRVGLLYQPFSWLSLYGNYSKALNAANSTLVLPGTQRKPEISEGYEAGLKGQWWNGDLTANLTFYELTKKNIAQPHPDTEFASLGYNIFVGKGRSRGIELDFSGRIADNWQLISTYSYTSTKVVQDDTGIAGNQFINVPRHAGSLWSKYDFADLGAKGLWLGAGVYLVGQRQGDNTNSFQMPGYARLDTGLGYSTQVGASKVSVQLNIDNLLDKDYYANSTWASRSIGIQPGSQRTFLGSVKIEY